MMRRAKIGRAMWGAPTAITASLGVAVLSALGLSALGLALGALQTGPAAAQTTGETTMFEDKPHRYTVILPAGCRHEEGPGTVDAICSPDFDPDKSAVADATSALVLGVAAESLDASTDTSIAGLLQRYTEGGFKEELPEAVCGESDRARVKIENLSQSVEDKRLVYTADVTCAEIKFLQIAPRRAAVRHVIGPNAVYRLVARAPGEAFEKQRTTINAFFASFRLASAEKTEK
jgi:hypothetical protein